MLATVAAVSTGAAGSCESTLAVAESARGLVRVPRSRRARVTLSSQSARISCSSCAIRPACSQASNAASANVWTHCARPQTGRRQGRRIRTVDRQTLDVGLAQRRERQTDGQDGVRGEPAAGQHRVDEGSSDASVAVGERVDRLELGMNEGGLRDR